MKKTNKLQGKRKIKEKRVKGQKTKRGPIVYDIGKSLSHSC